MTPIKTLQIQEPLPINGVSRVENMNLFSRISEPVDLLRANSFGLSSLQQNVQLGYERIPKDSVNAKDYISSIPSKISKRPEILASNNGLLEPSKNSSFIKPVQPSVQSNAAQYLNQMTNGTTQYTPNFTGPPLIGIPIGNNLSNLPNSVSTKTTDKNENTEKQPSIAVNTPTVIQAQKADSMIYGQDSDSEVEDFLSKMSENRKKSSIFLQ